MNLHALKWILVMISLYLMKYSISTQIGKKRVVLTSEWACNIQRSKFYVHDLLEEDLYLSSDNENIAGNQVGLALQGSVCVRRKVKNKSISTQIGVVHTSEWACNIEKRTFSAGEEYIS
jgi:hypothetical protein